MLLEGKKVYVGPFKNRSDRPSDREVAFTNVYVKNLPDSVDDDKLLELFGAFGETTSAVVMKVGHNPPLPTFALLGFCLSLGHRQTG